MADASRNVAGRTWKLGITFLVYGKTKTRHSLPTPHIGSSPKRAPPRTALGHHLHCCGFLNFSMHQSSDSCAAAALAISIAKFITENNALQSKSPKTAPWIRSVRVARHLLAMQTRDNSRFCIRPRRSFLSMNPTPPTVVPNGPGPDLLAAPAHELAASLAPAAAPGHYDELRLSLIHI